MKQSPPAHTDEVGVIGKNIYKALWTLGKYLLPMIKHFVSTLTKRNMVAFAEIGAGQEVANWFFRASGTAGTLAKTISAYDMTMSDAIYGKSKRYVSRDRLNAMLEYEYNLLVERLNREARL